MQQVSVCCCFFRSLNLGMTVAQASIHLPKPVSWGGLWGSKGANWLKIEAPRKRKAIRWFQEHSERSVNERCNLAFVNKNNTVRVLVWNTNDIGFQILKPSAKWSSSGLEERFVVPLTHRQGVPDSRSRCSNGPMFESWDLLTRQMIFKWQVATDDVSWPLK